jgi:hypothetical protein
MDQPSSVPPSEIEIPIYTDDKLSEQQRDADPRLREVGYYIEAQLRFENSKGRPFALTEITERYVNGDPYHFYMGRYFETLEDALSIAQLAEWHRRRSNTLAEQCVLEGYTVYDLQAYHAYKLLQAVPEIADPPSALEYYGNERTADAIPFQPTSAQINELLREGKGWSEVWICTLPPDPLRLVQWAPNAPCPTLDWVATVKRVAATVVTTHDDGTRWSHEHSIKLLLQAQQIPCHWYLIRAVTRRFVWESKGKISFGPNRSAWERFDTSMVRWKTEDPAEYAAVIPACSHCGGMKHLYTNCPGFIYGKLGERSYVHQPCPFDSFGCIPLEIENKEDQWRRSCCHCTAIIQKIDAGASSREIRAEIERRRATYLAKGGSPLRVETWKPPLS